MEDEYEDQEKDYYTKSYEEKEFISAKQYEGYPKRILNQLVRDAFPRYHVHSDVYILSLKIDERVKVQ
jgi:hypothetical protein